VNVSTALVQSATSDIMDIFVIPHVVNVTVKDAIKQKENVSETVRLATLEKSVTNYVPQTV
jgi:hypothetical protein